jgi:hypothetical protein
MKYTDYRERNLENMCTQEYASPSCARTDSKLSDLLKFVRLLMFFYIVNHELTNLLVSCSVHQHLLFLFFTITMSVLRKLFYLSKTTVQMLDSFNASNSQCAASGRLE